MYRLSCLIIYQGCILGAFIGDAAGGVLEFIRRELTSEDVKRAFKLLGGGAMKLGPA